MGQKVNPNGLRLGINRDWSSHWYASKKDFATCLKEDIAIRKYLESKLIKNDSGLSAIDIERVKDVIKVTIRIARPGIILGNDAEELKKYKKDLLKIVNDKKAEKSKLEINIVEVKNTALDAVLVARDVAKQLENRGSYRQVQKKALQRVMAAGALGCKVMSKGRVGGAEIARFEEYRQGVLSLHTLRQPIDYAHVDAHTIYGVIGVKVWIALPENYVELRNKKPEEARRGGNRRFNKDARKRTPKTAPAVTPSATKDEASKGE